MTRARRLAAHDDRRRTSRRRASLFGIVRGAARGGRARPLEFVDTGGGFGIDYGDGCAGPRPADFVRGGARRAARARPRRPRALRRAGALARRRARRPASRASIQTKSQPARARWLMIDAGMNDLIRPALYQARHRIVPRRARRRPRAALALARRRPGLRELRRLRRAPARRASRRALVAILDAGAYGYTMASRYNGRPLPAEVFLRGGARRRADASGAPPDEWVEERARRAVERASTGRAVGATPSALRGRHAAGGGGVMPPGGGGIVRARTTCPSTTISTPTVRQRRARRSRSTPRRRRAARPAARDRRRAPAVGRRVRSISRTLASSTQRKPLDGDVACRARRRRSPARACARASRGAARWPRCAARSDVGLEARRERARERLRRDDEIERLRGAADLDERRDRRGWRDLARVGPRRSTCVSRNFDGVVVAPAAPCRRASARPRGVRRSAIGRPSPSPSASRGRSSSSPRSRMPERGQALEDDAARDLHRVDRLDADALGPAAEQARRGPGCDDRVREVARERRPRDPAALAEIAQRLEHHLAHDAARARVALTRRRGGAPRARCAPRPTRRRAATSTKRRRASSCSASEPGRRARADRRGVPEADRARERDEERDVRRVAPEARRELLRRATSACRCRRAPRCPARATASASAIASGAGSSEKRARRGA